MEKPSFYQPDRRIVQASAADLEAMMAGQNKTVEEAISPLTGVTAAEANLATISEGLGIGQIETISAGRQELYHINPLEKEQEAIVDLGAEEFADEGALHPERYIRTANWIKQVMDYYGIDNPVIVDNGCGPGYLLAELAKIMPNGRFIGVDLSPTMLDRAKKVIAEQGLSTKIDLVHDDIAKATTLHGIADASVGRNSTHRADDLTLRLRRMADMLNARGTLMSTSFMSIKDMDKARQQRLVRDVVDRNMWPELQKLLFEAYTNAPTLDQYERSAREIAHEKNMQHLSVKPVPDLNSVNIVMSKREVK